MSVVFTAMIMLMIRPAVKNPWGSFHAAGTARACGD